MEGRMSCEPDEDGSNKKDIILSLNDPAYRQVMERFFKRLGPKTKTTAVPDKSKLTAMGAAKEVFNMLKNKGGRFCKLENWRGTDNWQVDEVGNDEALKKIRIDMGRRMDSAKRWLGTLGTEKERSSSASNESSHAEQRKQPTETPCIDHSILDVGSRVLVSCGVDESLFNATVKHHCIHDGRRSFLVRFDGNQSTKQSWIGEEEIAGVLFQRKQANTESILPTEEIGGVAETQHTTNHFDDPLGAADIRERFRMQEARIDALVGSHGDINTKVESLDCRSNQIASQNDLTSQILTDYDSAIIKLQEKTDRTASQFQGDAIKLKSNQRIQDNRIDRVQSELGDLSAKLKASNERFESSAGDLMSHLDGLVSQVAAFRRETIAVQTRIEDHCLSCSDRPHEEPLEESIIQALVTEAVDNSIKNNETMAKITQESNLFVKKVHEMSACSVDHSKGLSNHANALRALGSEQRSMKTTMAEFAEELQSLNRHRSQTAAKLNRIELQVTRNEARNVPIMTKLFSEIEQLKTLIAQYSTGTQSDLVTSTKRKSPQPTSSEGKKRPKLLSAEPNPQLDASMQATRCFPSGSSGAL